MKRPQLFTIMLAVFALVIVLGAGGTIGLFSLAVSGSTNAWGEPTRLCR